MLQTAFLSVKNILRKYIESINFTNRDYLLLGFLFLVLMSLLKIINSFGIQSKYTIAFLATIYVISSFAGNHKLFREYLDSDYFRYNQVFPLSPNKLMILKVIELESVILSEYALISSFTVLLLIITGYPALMSIFSVLSITLVALCIKNIIVILNAKKVKEGYILGVIIETLKVFLVFFYFHFLISFFNSISNPDQIYSIIKNLDHLLIMDYFFSVINQLGNIQTIILLLLTYVILIAIRTFTYSKLVSLQMKETGELHSNIIRFNKIFPNNILLIKELNHLRTTSIFRTFMIRISAYILFFVFVIGFDITFNLNYVIVTIIIFFELIYMTEKVTSSYLGKEKGFVLNYIFSGTSIRNILMYRTLVYSVITIVYMVFINLIMIILFEINFLNSIELMFIIICSAPSQIYISNFFNTYKTSYINDFGIPNKKMQLIKIIIKSIIAYVTLSFVTFIPFIFDGLTGFFILLLAFTVVNLTFFYLFYIYSKIKEKELYGEYGQAYSE